MARLGLPCYSPEQIQKAFGLDSLYRQGYDGKGQTIVILGTGNTPNIEKDLKAFDKAWGLPDPPSFKILQPFGPPVPYTCFGGEDGLQIETTLDVEWSHAIAPGASIVVVIGANSEQTYLPPPAGATNCSFYDLEQAAAYALDNHLGNIISISYGGSELGAKTDTATDKANEQKELSAADSIFKRAASMGVTVMASTGDTGATNGDDNSDPSKYWDKPNISWPASDPYVLAVGGTTLTIKDDSGTYGNEVVWNDPATGGATGGGISALYDEPAYQKTVPNQALFQGKRGIPDVAFPADVNYSLYVSLSPGIVDAAKYPHWVLIGGTSASSPCWAGIIAIADQMSVQMGGQPLGFIHPALYSLQGQGMHDITQGDNSFIGVQGYKAEQGYDLASGWGTPIADQFIPALVQAVQQVGNTP
jgi:subtilase family serine protease